jgi:hypothetical protein
MTPCLYIDLVTCYNLNSDLKHNRHGDNIGSNWVCYPPREVAKNCRPGAFFIGLPSNVCGHPVTTWRLNRQILKLDFANCFPLDAEKLLLGSN